MTRHRSHTTSPRRGQARALTGIATLAALAALAALLLDPATPAPKPSPQLFAPRTPSSRPDPTLIDLEPLASPPPSTPAAANPKTPAPTPHTTNTPSSDPLTVTLNEARALISQPSADLTAALRELETLTQQGEDPQRQLLAALDATPEPPLQRLLTLALAAHGAETIRRELRERALLEDPPWREAALLALSRHPRDDDITSLLRFATNPREDESARRAVILSLGPLLQANAPLSETSRKTLGETLKALTASDSSALIRDAAALALSPPTRPRRSRR